MAVYCYARSELIKSKTIAIVLDAANVLASGPGWLARKFFVLFPFVINFMKTYSEKILKSTFHNPDAFDVNITGKDQDVTFRVKNWNIALAKFTNYSRTPELEQDLPAIQIPVLVIYGKNDPVFPEKDQQKMCSYLKEVAVVQIDECGHVPHWEKKEAFLQALIPFLQKF